MPEVPQEFPRAFVEFMDPDDETQLFKCDLTWLTSRWLCIYGQGCGGIMPGRPDDGCCTLGAHFSDKKDRKRTEKWAAELTAEEWEFHAEGTAEGVIGTDTEGSKQTRVVEGACIFLNRPGFAGGEGCSLHNHAVRIGRKPLELKPDVCWQLPIRRSFEERDLGGGQEISVVVISEYDRRGWGPGGADLNWYCSGNTDAHVGPDPVYVSEHDTLVELMGPRGYALLAAHCEAHLAALAAAAPPQRKLLALHPADPAF